ALAPTSVSRGTWDGGRGAGAGAARRAIRPRPALSPVRPGTALPRLVHVERRLGGVRSEVRAGAGLLGGRHLRELRLHDADRRRGLLPAAGVGRPGHPLAAHAVGAVRDRLPAVVLPLQPQPVAGTGVRVEPGAVRSARW